MFMVAAFLPRWVVALLGVCCAILAEMFSSLPPSLLRLGFEILALGGCGLFVCELNRNRRLTLQVEARLKAMVETSPAAIGLWMGVASSNWPITLPRLARPA